MGWTFTFFISLVVAVHSIPQSNLDDIIGDVFQTETSSQSILNRAPNDADCTQENGQPGQCVQYYLCSNATNTIITDGVGLIDIRLDAGAACSDYIDICCGSPDILENPILPPTTPRPTPRPGTNPVVPGGGTGTKPVVPGGGTGTKPVVPGGGANTGSGGVNSKNNGIRGCGQRNPDGVGFRITGATDNEASFGEFPWMVAILREEPVATSDQKLNVYICGGSLIHPKVVMTSAHCVVAKNGPLKLKIRAGEWDTQTKREIFPHQDRNVVKIVSHEQYYAGGLYNDVALLILDTPVTDAENIGVVCLPPEDEEPPNAKCYVTGWGKDIFGKEGKYQVILKRLGLPIVQRKKCQEDLRKTRLGGKFMLHRTFICAGGEPGKDACRGDGGSPLVCPMPGKPNKYMQSGIVAWGIGCGESSVPGVYAHVSSLRKWIDDQLYINNINDMNLYAP